jgi:hypothetical protein
MFTSTLNYLYGENELPVCAYSDDLKKLEADISAVQTDVHFRKSPQSVMADKQPYPTSALSISILNKLM